MLLRDINNNMVEIPENQGNDNFIKLEKRLSFNQLSREIQKKILIKYRDINVNDNFWFEFIIEDYKEFSKIIGLIINDIYFSLYDRNFKCSFTGSYEYKKNSVKEIKDYMPNANDIHEISERLFKIQQDNFFKLKCDIRVNSYDVMIFNIYKDEQEFECQELEEIFKDYANIIYEGLKNEYDYQASEEGIKDFFENNGWLFNEKGEKIHD